MSSTCPRVSSPFESASSRKKHVQVLEHLSEPETFHVIDLARGGVVDVVDAGVRDRRWEVRLETFDGGRRPVEIFGVASRAPCIKVGLEDLGTHDIVRPGDVETVLVVKLELLGGECRVARAAIAGDVGEQLGSDASAVGIRRVSMPSSPGKENGADAVLA